MRVAGAAVCALAPGVSAAAQIAATAAALGENATAAGWKTIPSWYQLSRQDNAIAPQAQEFMAKRMNSVTEEIDGSHTAFIAHPERIAAFINKALAQS